MPNGNHSKIPKGDLLFFRPAELTLLFARRDGGEEYPEIDPEDLQAALDDPAFRAVATITLKKGADALRYTFDPEPGQRGEPPQFRTVVPMPRGGQRGTLVLQTFNLSSWKANLDHQARRDKLGEAIDEVVKAVEGIGEYLRQQANGDVPEVKVGPYELVAGSPNWLGTAF